MGALNALAERHGLLLLEDAAQAHGARFRRAAGSAGSGTSRRSRFYPSKNLGALGDAGAICTDDAAIADRARALRNLGQRRRNHHELIGYNERLDGVQAACLRVKLPYLDEWNHARRGRAERYADGLAGADVRLLAETADTPCVYHLFPVRVDERDARLGRLQAAGIGAGVHYPVAAHRHPAIVEQFDTPAPGALPIAEAWASEELSLPMFAELRDDELDRVVDVLRAG